MNVKRVLLVALLLVVLGLVGRIGFMIWTEPDGPGEIIHPISRY